MLNGYKEELLKILNKEVIVFIDRKINSVHPKYNDIIYQVNYGYIKDVKAPDGEYQDAYVLGVNNEIEVFKGVVIAIIERLDDVEHKLIVVPKGFNYTNEEIDKIVNFQEKYFKIQIRTSLCCKCKNIKGTTTD